MCGWRWALTVSQDRQAGLLLPAVCWLHSWRLTYRSGGEVCPGLCEPSICSVAHGARDLFCSISAPVRETPAAYWRGERAKLGSGTAFGRYVLCHIHAILDARVTVIYMAAEACRQRRVKYLPVPSCALIWLLLLVGDGRIWREKKRRLLCYMNNIGPQNRANAGGRRRSSTAHGISWAACLSTDLLCRGTSFHCILPVWEEQ